MPIAIAINDGAMVGSTRAVCPVGKDIFALEISQPERLAFRAPGAAYAKVAKRSERIEAASIVTFGRERKNVVS